jgi:hypothetical protein
MRGFALAWIAVMQLFILMAILRLTDMVQAVHR